MQEAQKKQKAVCRTLRERRAMRKRQHRRITTMLLAKWM